MNAQSDHQLLQAYAGRRDEAAFRELVRRHTDLVYSAALRQVESDATARDLTQGVFTDLARKADAVLGKQSSESLAGWLHRATRYAALNHRRDAHRRRENERQAMEQLLTNSDFSGDWEQIRPVLDEALDSLEHSDREAILLRFFKNQDFRTVGDELGVSDDTAQKRVSRAVDRLREFLAKRGVTVGAGGLAVMISANAVQAAPVGLAVTISAAALAGTAVTTSTLIAATTKTIAMTTLQKTLVTATVAVLVGAGIYEARQAAQLRDQIQTLQQQQSPLSKQIQQLQKDKGDLAKRLGDVADELAKRNGTGNELLKLRGEVTRLRREANTLAKDAEDAKGFQSDMMQVISNTPPVRTFVSTTTTSAAWNQAIVTGGWKTPSGRRAIVLVQMYPGDDSRQLTIVSKVLEYTETAGEQLGLSQFNLDDRSSEGSARASSHKLTSEQAELLLKSAREFEDMQISSSPAVSTFSGRQAQIQAGEIRQTLSGEKYALGPVIDFTPTISADGQSVQLAMTAQLNFPVMSPKH